MSTLIIYRLGSLGDTIVALPAFHRIARAFPSHRRLLLTNVPISTQATPSESVLVNSGLIDGAIEYPLGMRSLSAFKDLVRRLRNTRADTLIYLATNRGAVSLYRDLVFFKLAGLNRIIGAPTQRDLRENRLISNNVIEREASRLARTLHELGSIDLDDLAGWDLHLTTNEKKTAGAAIASLGTSPFFAINMGGKVPQKDWGEKNWQALIEVMARQYSGLALGIFGGREDQERGNSVAKCWPGKAANLCGVLSPRESAAALSYARFFIGHDSGPLHLSAAVQVPCVGLFGDYNLPMKWHPYGERHRIIHNMRGVSMITVDDVIKAVVSVLS